MIDWLQHFSWPALLQIIVIDLLLGGDNAVVIALASRNLPPDLRRRAVLLGTGGAVLLRVVLLVLAVGLLNVPGLKLVGALLLLWIGIKLLASPDDDAEIKGAASFMGAVRTIIIADAVMSLDNVVAVASAADGDVWMAALGVLISIPVIVGASRILLALIDRLPWIVALGAGLLGWVAGEMALGDPLLLRWLPAVDDHGRYLAAACGALLVVGIGWWWRRVASGVAHRL